MGVSQWRELGKKFGYWDYFEKQIQSRAWEECREAMLGAVPKGGGKVVEGSIGPLFDMGMNAGWNAARSALLAVKNPYQE